MHFLIPQTTALFYSKLPNSDKEKRNKTNMYQKDRSGVPGSLTYSRCIRILAGLVKIKKVKYQVSQPTGF